MRKLQLLLPLMVVLMWSVTAQARRSTSMMSKCTFLYTNPDMARKKLVEFFDTLHFTSGEHVAEVGASGANLAGMFSLSYKNIDYTLEDIDSTCLNNRQVASVLQYYAGINGGRQPEGFNCHVVIGNDSSTTLPRHAFKKVFFINTYHEVSRPVQMLADINRILAPDGVLYMQEEVSTKNKRLRKAGCHHLLPVEDRLLSEMKAAGFRLIKVNVKDRQWRITGHSKSCWYQFAKA